MVIVTRMVVLSAMTCNKNLNSAKHKPKVSRAKVRGIEFVPTRAILGFRNHIILFSC